MYCAVKPFTSEWLPCYYLPPQSTSAPDNATPQSTKNNAHSPPNSREGIQRLSVLILANRLDMFTKLIATDHLNLQGADRENSTTLHEGRNAAIPFPETLLARRDNDINLYVAAAVSTDPAVIHLLLEGPRVDGPARSGNRR
ncbi:unnamed protein product [Tuber melanosporum]|uniref:(Perigord truffle) hypothetical protein n=1 Tax=Tuber melanosporum (strain Mel28) TaxID=656061 RepID=D5GBT6_TUBMM|nr:uncharacterized protein GSTUM_00005572001 [Tuber melanosporum]CAZ81936.1 unnamed protein product [Tuber melanosporum]